MNYFRCRVCGKLNADDGFFCDAHHATAWRGQKQNLEAWLKRTQHVPDYEFPSVIQDWEFDFNPL